MNDVYCSESEFIRRATPILPHLQWFLGAGTSRTAGMPTAADIIWDLKQRYYCLHENQDVQAHNVNNRAVREKIQSYLDSKGFPAANAPDEYPFYFSITFGDNLVEQQRYIAQALHPDKISLNVGHRALAAMLSAGVTRVIFTSNFDEVLEKAYAFVAAKPLTAFHLEGSYAALDALNAEQYPLYAKVHGDFRFRNIKNLPADLLGNDAEIQKCFLAASTRFGMIVSGYSGRDTNVMNMFRTSLDQSNAFPHGLFWTTSNASSVSSAVMEFVMAARSRGVSAQIVESSTFDTMLMRLWRQQHQRPPQLETKIYTAKASPVSIPLPTGGKRYPVIRTNGLPIDALPKQCGKAITAKPVTFQILNEQRSAKQPDIVTTFTGQTLFWGSEAEATKLFSEQHVAKIEAHEFDDPVHSIASSGIVKSFFEEGLVRSVCNDKPVVVRRKDKTWFAVIDHRESKNPRLAPIRQALVNGGNSLNGPVPKLADTFWAECVSLHLEERNGASWLMIRPDIWITPLANREQATVFLRAKKLRRWNASAYRLLDAWIGLLVGSVGEGDQAQVSCFQNTKYPVSFTLNTRSGYSRRGGENG